MFSKLLFYFLEYKMQISFMRDYRRYENIIVCENCPILYIITLKLLYIINKVIHGGSVFLFYIFIDFYIPSTFSCPFKPTLSFLFLLLAK